MSKSKKEQPKSHIYLGPTIPGTELERYKVFKGQLPSVVDKIGASVPAIKRLIVDTKEMAEVERKITDKTSIYANAFAEVLNHIKGVIKR